MVLKKEINWNTTFQIHREATKKDLKKKNRILCE